MSSIRASSDQQTMPPGEVRKRQADRPPSLKVWVFALLFGLIFIGGFELASLEIEIPPSEAFVNHNLARIRRFAELSAKEPEKLKLVLLGNSLIKYGTEIDEETFRYSGSDDVLAIRIVNNWANFTDFEALTDELLALEPDMIVMQTVLLGRVRLIEHFLKPAQLQHYVTWILFGPGDWDPLKLNQYDLQTDQVDFDDQTEERFEWQRKSFIEWQGIDLDGPDAQQANDFIESATQRGSSFVLLYTPVTERAEQLRDIIKSQLAEAVTQHIKSGGVTLLEYPDSLEQSQFSDYVHLNESGRKIYSKWLIAELLKLVRSSTNSNSQPPS